MVPPAEPEARRTERDEPHVAPRTMFNRRSQRAVTGGPAVACGEGQEEGWGPGGQRTAFQADLPAVQPRRPHARARIPGRAAFSGPRPRRRGQHVTPPPSRAGRLQPVTAVGCETPAPTSTRDESAAGRLQLSRGWAPPPAPLASPAAPTRDVPGPSRGQSLSAHVHFMSVMDVKSACQ